MDWFTAFGDYFYSVLALLMVIRALFVGPVKKLSGMSDTMTNTTDSGKDFHKIAYDVWYGNYAGGDDTTTEKSKKNIKKKC